MNRFIGSLLMAAGALLALTTGLCSAVATISMLSLGLSNLGGERPGSSIEVLWLLIIPAIGFGVAFVGVLMFRFGRGLCRRVGPE